MTIEELKRLLEKAGYHLVPMPGLGSRVHDHAGRLILEIDERPEVMLLRVKTHHYPDSYAVSTFAIADLALGNEGPTDTHKWMLAFVDNRFPDRGYASIVLVQDHETSRLNSLKG